MDSTASPTIDLNEIRLLLDGESDDARFEAFSRLYASACDLALNEIEAIISRTDPVLKIQFLRFLARVPELRAVDYMARLLRDANHVVVDVAKNVFEKNHCSTKLHALLPLVTCGFRPAQIFSIERLALGGKHEVVDLLLDFLKQDPDEELLIASLTALRHFDDPRLASAILKYASDPRHEVRFRTILIFGQLHTKGDPIARRELYQALNDSLARIRQAVVWSLRTRVRKQDLALYEKLSRNDPDPLVRMECLPGLGLFPKPRVMEHLLQIIVSERARIVSLKAESVLTGMPKRAMDKAVYKILKSPDQQIRHRAIILFAEFQQGSQKYFRYLEKQLKTVSTDKDRLPVIEALASLGDVRAFDLLEKELKASFLVAYTAMSSMMKLWRQYPAHQAPLRYLEDPGIPDLLKQMILKHLVHSAHPRPYPEDLLRVLFLCLKSTNLNIRYLAAQAVIQSETADALEPLFAMILNETDAVAIKLLRESIVKHLSRDPSGVVKLLARYLDHSSAMEQLLSMIEMVDALGGGFVMSLLGPPYNLLLTAYGARCARHVGQMVFKGRLSLSDLLESVFVVEGRELVMTLFGSQLADHPHFPVHLPVSLMRKWFDGAGPVLVKALLYLCVRSGARDFIPVLVDLASAPEYQKSHRDIADALNLLMDVAA